MKYDVLVMYLDDDKNPRLAEKAANGTYVPIPEDYRIANMLTIEAKNIEDTLQTVFEIMSRTPKCTHGDNIRPIRFGDAVIADRDMYFLTAKGWQTLNNLIN